MPDETPPGETPSTPPPRRRTLTPEQRRLLGAPRPRDAERSSAEEETEIDPEPAPESTEAATPVSAAPPARSEARPRPVRSQPVDPTDPSAVSEHSAPEEEESHRGGGLMRPDQTAARTSEMQRAIIIVGAILLLGLTFYVGAKFPYWRYKLFQAGKTPSLEGTVANKFPGVSVDDLVTQGLKAQRAGDFQDAAERLLAAKHKSLEYRGILARVAKLAYDQRDFTTADGLFERAIAFGENVDTSNYYRGLIAVRRKDLPAARRAFEAATVAEPFVAEYFFYLGETFRLDHQPLESIPRYTHAILLSQGGDQETICEFKIRMARLEAAEASEVRKEAEAKQQAGPLPVDWLMTMAALHLREGRLSEAVSLIRLAHDGNAPVVFAACATDSYFVEASAKHPQVADACQLPAG